MRKITDDDLKILEHKLKTNLETYINNNDQIIVLNCEGQILGAGAVRIDGTKGEITFIEILPEGSNQGFEDALVRALINYSDRRGVTTLFISSDKNIQKEFLKRIGFTQEDNGLSLDVEEFFNNPHCNSI
jgi:ribosomal protein S18 acetylase RimI-like enzyme